MRSLTTSTLVATMMMLCVACTSSSVEPAQLDISTLQFTDYEVVVPPEIEAKLNSSGGKGPARLAVSLERALTDELYVATEENLRPIRIETQITDVRIEGFPKRLTGDVRLVDVQDESELTSFKVMARYGEGGLFRSVGQSVVTTMLQIDTISRLSEVFAEEVRTAIEASDAAQ